MCYLLPGCAGDEPTSEHDAEWAANVCAAVASRSDETVITDAQPISATTARDLKGAQRGYPPAESLSEGDLALCTVLDSRLPSDVRMLADEDGDSVWVVVPD